MLKFLPIFVPLRCVLPKDPQLRGPTARRSGLDHRTQVPVRLGGGAVVLRQVVQGWPRVLQIRAKRASNQTQIRRGGRLGRCKYATT